jgi:hypothetical protein
MTDPVDSRSGRLRGGEENHSLAPDSNGIDDSCDLIDELAEIAAPIDESFRAFHALDDLSAPTTPSEWPLITETRKVIQPPISARTSARAFRTDRPHSDSELRQIFDRMLETKKCPPLAAIEPLREWIGREMVKAIEESNYMFGEQLAVGRALLDSFLRVEEDVNVKQARRKLAKQRYRAARENLAMAENQWNEKIALLKQKHENRIAELEIQHQEQISEFERQWADSEFVSQFYKPSPRLLLLRATERKLAVFQDFQEANLVKKNADRLEKKEVADARWRAVATMRLYK